MERFKIESVSRLQDVKTGMLIDKYWKEITPQSVI